MLKFSPLMQKAERQFHSITRLETPIVLLAAGLILVSMTAPAFRYYFFDENFQYLGIYRTAGDNFWRAVWSPFAGFCFRPVSVAQNLPWHFILPTEPWIYHLRNFVFSLINFFLLYRVLLRLVASRWARLLAFFFFVISKVHITTIGYINLYDSIMMLMFLLLTILFFLRYFEKRRALDYGLALVFSFMSIFVKDYGLVIVAVVIALVAFYELSPRDWLAQGGRWLLRLCPLVLMTILYLGLRFAIVGPLPKDNPGYSPQLSARVAISNALGLTSSMGNLSLTGLSYTDVGALGGSGLGTLIGRLSGWSGGAGLIDGAAYVLLMLLLLGTIALALARGTRWKLIFPLVWIAAYFGPPLLIRNLQIYYFYEPLAGTAVLLGMCLDGADRKLLKVWTLVLVLVGITGLISNYTSLYHWQSGAYNVAKIQKPLLEAHRGEHVDEIIFVGASKPFWVWAFAFHPRAPMLAELMKLPELRVTILDYYEVPRRQVPASGKTLFFEIDKNFNFIELRSLAELPIRTMTPPGTDNQLGPIKAVPNPIRVCDGSGLGVTTISYAVPGNKSLELHVGSPDGALFAKTLNSGAGTTGKWVNDGLVFFLQDVSSGKPLKAQNTIATVTVYLTSEGCQ